VFFLFGQEEHLREAAAREIVAAHLDPATRDFNLDEVRATEVALETLGSLIQTPPMMAEWRVVIVRDTEALSATATPRALLEAVVGNPPPGLVLVLIGDPGKSTARIWKTVKDRATSVEFPRLSDADMPGWLMGWAERAGLTLEVGAARALAAAVGPDLGAAVREMEKLREYVGDRPAITRADVVAVVGAIPRQDRWEWIDAVAEGRFDEARAGLPVLLDMGETGVGLVIGLGNQFLRLAVCKAGGRGALESRLPGNQKWLARRVEAQARHWTADDLEGALDHLWRADRLLKSAPLTDLQLMEELLLRLQHQHREAA
jgi:DNA polymerase III subunit delta